MKVETAQKHPTETLAIAAELTSEQELLDAVVSYYAMQGWPRYAWVKVPEWSEEMSSAQSRALARHQKRHP